MLSLALSIVAQEGAYSELLAVEGGGLARLMEAFAEGDSEDGQGTTPAGDKVGLVVAAFVFGGLSFPGLRLGIAVQWCDCRRKRLFFFLFRLSCSFFCVSSAVLLLLGARRLRRGLGYRSRRVGARDE